MPTRTEAGACTPMTGRGREAGAPTGLTTTLYELLATRQAVVAAVRHLLPSGRLTVSANPR